MPRIAFPAGAEEVIRKLVAEQFGEGIGTITGISTMRVEATEEYHQTQLREKPDDPNPHSNYGAFLVDRGQENEAEKEYRAALALQPTHANALGNLANLESSRDRLDEAQDLYERALAAEPGHENVSWNFARFLFRCGDPARALNVAQAGSSKNPQSGRLHLLEGEMRLLNGDAEGALAKVANARSNGADQAQVESLNAFATQMSGAPLGGCIAAYEVAISVRPDEPNLHLNLAQLLFLRGDSARAARELPSLDGLADDGKLECLFYQLAHTADDPRAIATSMKTLVEAGGRTSWNFGPDIEMVGAQDLERSRVLRGVADALAGGSTDVLDRLISGSTPTG